MAVGEPLRLLIQLLAPLDGLDDRQVPRPAGPGLQQLAYRVTDVEAVSAVLRERGLRLLYDAPRRGTAGSRVNFVHPKDAGGVLVELVQPAVPPDTVGHSGLTVGTQEVASTPDQCAHARPVGTLRQARRRGPDRQDDAERPRWHRRRQGRPRPRSDALGAALHEPSPGRLGGDRPEAVGAVLDVRRPEPAARRCRGPPRGQGVRVLPELCAVLGQAGEGQPLARVDPRDRRPRTSTTARSPTSLESPAEDGGQWTGHLFLALVAKHGLVPKEVMPRDRVVLEDPTTPTATFHSLLRRAAHDLRETAYGRVPAPKSRHEAKSEVLAAVHRILQPAPRHAAHVVRLAVARHRQGLPPRRHPSLRREFVERYVTLPIEDYVCVVHDPRPSSPFGRTFTVEHLGNVVGAPPGGLPQRRDSPS